MLNLTDKIYAYVQEFQGTGLGAKRSNYSLKATKKSTHFMIELFRILTCLCCFLVFELASAFL